MDIYINNTRTFESYLDNPHHHDLMLANGCMAGVYDDQDKVDRPETGDIIALYANDVGIVAYGRATDVTIFLDDDRVGGHPTRLRKLNDFKVLAYPLRESEYETSSSQTLQMVHQDKEGFWNDLKARTRPEADPYLFTSFE